MVLVEPCTTKGCQGMSIDGCDGRCEYCLTPQLKLYTVTGSITRIIEAQDEDSACESFEQDFDDSRDTIEFDDIEVDEIDN